MALGAALVIAVAAFVVLRRTYFGKALRALAYDREIAAAYGVDHRRIGAIAAGLASGMAAVAGVLIAINQSLFPQLAVEWVGLVFTVVILGGIGNLLGAVGAGILIGLVSSLVGVAWTPQGSPLVVFLLLILALLFRPNGLFGRLGT
jgi:branched-chain amino acid transport system permease protein